MGKYSKDPSRTLLCIERCSVGIHGVGAGPHSHSAAFRGMYLNTSLAHQKIQPGSRDFQHWADGSACYLLLPDGFVYNHLNVNPIALAIAIEVCRLTWLQPQSLLDRNLYIQDVHGTVAIQVECRRTAEAEFPCSRIVRGILTREDIFVRSRVVGQRKTLRTIDRKSTRLNS